MTWRERRALRDIQRKVSAGRIVVYEVEEAPPSGWGLCTKCNKYMPVRNCNGAPRCSSCWPQTTTDITPPRAHVPFANSTRVWGFQIHPEVKK